MQSAQQIIDALSLSPHPEGGYFCETFRDNDLNGRSVSTAIYYLLPKGERSHWHRVDAVEIWHWYAGAPLSLSVKVDNMDTAVHTLGSDIIGGQLPQVVVPAHAWQSAESLGEWTLIGCTVAPGFEFDGFEMAPDGWSPSN